MEIGCALKKKARRKFFFNVFIMKKVFEEMELFILLGA